MTFSFSKDFKDGGATLVENAFITEYLPLSKGDAVRVYLYGLFLCQNPSRDEGIKEIAENLKLSETEILDCLEFWEQFGIISVLSKDPLTVQYYPLSRKNQPKAVKYDSAKYSEFTKGVQAMIPSRMISTGEYTGYFNIMETYGIKPEAMLMIVRYCVQLKGDDIGARYIFAVAKDFGAKGITTASAVDKELSAFNLRKFEVEKVLRALGSKRSPDVEDINLYKKWTRELSFEPDAVLFSASKLKKGSMEKLDAFLMELFSKKSFGTSEIEEYIKNKQNVFDLAVRINKALSVYVEVVETEIDTYVNKWLSYGFEEDALVFIANRLFKTGNNTLSSMDEAVENLKETGAVSLTAVSDFYGEEEKADEFIKRILLTCGISRKPTPWDRENLKRWREWNFTDEMILEAARLSAGKSSPVSYMNGILSNWKTSGTYTLENAETNIRVQNIGDTQESYNAEYERRRMVAILRAQKNTERAMELPGFPDVYSRLFAIEKDMAFAEVGGNTEALKSLEQEKRELSEKAEDMLIKIGITLSDLSPKYACEKCNDTGYVGTHRCDCLQKKVD